MAAGIVVVRERCLSDLFIGNGLQGFLCKWFFVEREAWLRPVGQ